MREYETTFIFQPEISDEGCQEICERIDATLKKAGAERLLHDDQGKRRLAYEIRKFQKGRYVTTYYLSEGAAVAPLEQQLRIEESVLRFLTVLKAEQVLDIEARRTQAAAEAEERAERARERAAREAEEERARAQVALEAQESEDAESADEVESADEADDADAADEADDADATSDADETASDADADAENAEEENAS